MSPSRSLSRWRGLAAAVLVAWSTAELGWPAPGASVGLAAPQAAAQPSDARTTSRVDARMLADDLRALADPAMEGRLTGSAGSRKAQAFILARFKALKLQPLNGSFEQKFSFTERGPTSGSSPTRPTWSG